MKLINQMIGGILERHELKDGGVLFFDESFLSSALALEYFHEIKNNTLWVQMPGVFGHMQPRLTASYGDEGLVYSYSGTRNYALPWTSTLLEIKQRLENLMGSYNYCLLNRYRSGKDSISMHSDDEPGLVPLIAAVSLGATRIFKIRHKVTKETRNFSLQNGSLIIMGGTMQEFWQHEIPKTKDDVAERISLTFRRIS
jgi:alkylated DNA repair dioxygenase AlkB